MNSLPPLNGMEGWFKLYALAVLAIIVWLLVK